MAASDLKTAEDLPEKGAIVQRDRETYAIAPHIPGGIIDPAGLRKIADVAEKYHAKVLKLTSAQRIAIVGIAPEDIEKAWKDLGMAPGHAIGLCVDWLDLPRDYLLQEGQAGLRGHGLEAG